MCKSITIRFSCGHARIVCLSTCRRTHAHLVCKGAKKGDLPAIRMETLCISCYAAWQPDSTALVPKVSEVELIWRFSKKTIMESVKEVQNVNEIAGLMKTMRVRHEKSDGVVARRNVGGGMGNKEILPKRKEEKWARKGKSGSEKVKRGKKVNGGSPLRFELTVEDLEVYEQEQKREKGKMERERKAKERRDEIMSWPAAKAKLSSFRGRAVTLSTLLKMQEEEAEEEAERGEEGEGEEGAEEEARMAREVERRDTGREPPQYGFGAWSASVASCFCAFD